jgi:hypothetical protein
MKDFVVGFKFAAMNEVVGAGPRGHNRNRTKRQGVTF